LSYIEVLPLDRIKIDRSFVASLGQSERSLAIVRAVIRLAHGLGVPVLAEGIETDAQMSLLRQQGCDEMQGYLIGRPRSLASEQGETLRLRAFDILGKRPQGRLARSEGTRPPGCRLHASGRRLSAASGAAF